MVEWVHSILLKNLSLWAAKIPNVTSWVWRKILQTRGLAQPFIRHIVGNGNNISFWFDTWHPLGPLYKRFTGNLLYSFGCKPHALVSEIIVDGRWRWPVGRKATAEVKRFKEATPECLVPLTMFEDQVVWNGSSSRVFNAKNAVKKSRGSREEVTWAKLV
ncbi:uncharacterized protein LOC113780595 [Coffea eugenioides]|uniref:uncharacterized protein LOC113780595 n=1 Tax=Coffea eugenioides TaxID=49369 RepID=UPI000F60FC38|nr:uncharacterized protein LOC113780595 [Coffea eugenioides]